MSDVQLYLLDFDANKQGALATARKSARSLEDKSLKLVDLIEGLREYINSEDAATRAKVMAYLADVLSPLPSKILSLQQRELLNDFVLSRICNGADGLGHCAKSLVALERLGKFSDERVKTVLETVLHETSPLVTVKAQSERYQVLILLDMLMSNYRKVLQEFYDEQKELVPRLIAYFDGEKDPRNLMIVFSVLLVPMVEWDIGSDALDLFEAVFNYFPITFRPPPNDPYGITSQDLKDRLQDCIAASAYFAPHAFPALLDKLDSTSINTKRDTLRTITACVLRYGPATVNLYAITLWDALKFEILNVQEEDLAEEALKALLEIARQLSFSPHDGPLQNYLRPIAKECNEHLDDAPTKQSSAAGRILGAVSKASDAVAAFLIRAVSPHLFALYKTADNTPRRRGLLEVLNSLVLSDVAVHGSWQAGDVASENHEDAMPAIEEATTKPKEDLDFGGTTYGIFANALTQSPINEVSFRLLALEGLRNMCKVRQLLDNATIGQIIRIFDDIILNEGSYSKDEVKAAAIDALVEVAHQKPQLVVETAMPEFLGRLPDTDIGSTAGYVAILEAFAKLSAEPQIFSTIVLRLKNKLYAAARQGSSPGYIASILQALLYAFANGAADVQNPSVFASYYSELLVPLIKESCITTGALASAVGKDEIILELVGRIGNLLLRPQEWVSQVEMCRNIYTLYSQVEVANVAPFTIPADGTPSSTMLVSTQLLAAAQREATPYPDLQSLLHHLVEYSNLESLSARLRSSCIQQVSLMVNKYISAPATKDTLSQLFAGPGSLLETPTPTRLRLAFAVLKALTLRIDPQQSKILPSFLALLSDPALSLLAARGFSTLLAPDDILTKENHCQVYRLHKQRLFALTVPNLISAFREPGANEQTRRCILIALSGIIYWIPYDLLRQELEQLIPLLLQSLAVEDPDVKVNSIATFSKIVLEDPKLVESHISSLVARLLALSQPVPVLVTPTTVDNINPPKARAAALACLETFVSSFRAELLLPHKHLVVRELLKPLDDKRRAVRAEGVRCRKTWLSLGGSGEDD